MQPDWLGPFVRATAATLEELAAASPRRRGSEMANPPAAGRSVTVVFGLSGEASGTVALVLPRRTAVEVAGRVVGARLRRVDGVVRATLAQLGRMIAGRARRQLAKAGRRVVLARPQVVVAPRRLCPCDGGRSAAVAFDSDAGPFVIEARLASRPAHPPA